MALIFCKLIISLIDVFPSFTFSTISKTNSGPYRQVHIIQYMAVLTKIKLLKIMIHHIIINNATNEIILRGI